MMRKLLVFLLVISLLFLYSCNLSEEYPPEECPPEKEGQVDFVDENQLVELEYQGEVYELWDPGTPYNPDYYNFKDEAWLQENGFVLISWENFRSFYLLEYTERYYAYSTKSPLFFIRLKGDLYVKETFDWKQEVFVLADTDVEIVFSDMYPEDAVNLGSFSINRYPLKEYTWVCKEYPALDTKIVIFKAMDTYYMQIQGRLDFTYPISPEFQTLLSENDLLPIESPEA